MVCVSSRTICNTLSFSVWKCLSSLQWEIHWVINCTISANRFPFCQTRNFLFFLFSFSSPEILSKQQISVRKRENCIRGMTLSSKGKIFFISLETSFHHIIFFLFVLRLVNKIIFQCNTTSSYRSFRTKAPHPKKEIFRHIVIIKLQFASLIYFLINYFLNICQNAFTAIITYILHIIWVDHKKGL